MSVRFIADAIWMHRNSTRLIHRLPSCRNNARIAINTIYPSQFQLGLSSSSFNQLVWRASSTKRTTRTYNPYDALRREEQVLREQDNKTKSSTSQLGPDPPLDESVTNIPFDRNPPPSEFEYKVQTPTDGYDPFLVKQAIQEEYDNFETDRKSRHRPHTFDKLLDDNRDLTRSVVLKTIRDEASFDVVGGVDIFKDRSHTVADPWRNNCNALHQSQCKAIEMAFFKIKDRILKLHIQTRDISLLRRIHQDEHQMATKILHNSNQLQISTCLETWRNSANVLSIESLLVGSALSSAREALKVLTALGDSIEEFNLRVSFLHLVHVLHQEAFEQDLELLRQLDRNIDQLKNPMMWPSVPIKLDFVLLAMNRLNDTQLHEIVCNLDTKYYDPGPYQCRFYTRLCLGKGWTEMAFRMFKKLRKEILQTPREEVVSLIARLIKRDTVVDGPNGPNFRFLSELLQKGVVLDAALYSCVIERALELGYPNVAWDLYDHLKQSGSSIESRTYLLLLRHSFSIRDEQRVHEIMSEMHTQNALYTNPHLLSCAMNIVRNVCFFYQNMEATECLSHLLPLYDRAYSRAPLIRLGIVTELGPRESVENLPEPDTYMLSFVIWAYILCHRHIPSALKIWERIHQRIQKGDPAVVECMRMDFLYNAYILLYRRSAKTLPHALEMFQYMLEKRWCLPSERTWGIIIFGFLQHGQHAEARRLMELMRAHGFTTQILDPLHLPRCITMEGVEAVANRSYDEFLMPDGSNPLHSQLVSGDNFDHEMFGLAKRSIKPEVSGTDGDENQARNFEASGPFARLITT